MQTRMIGDISVTRVEEILGPGFLPTQLCPDFQPEALQRHRNWLVPNHYHEKSGRLIGSVHSWVLRTGRHTILVDTCVGNDKTRHGFPSWTNRQGPFLERLAEAGVAPEAVDFVLCTHLHVDHVGWNTRLVDGRWVPTFPNAKYLFARREYDHWQQIERQTGDRVDDGSFDDSVLPVVEAGQALLVESDRGIEDGLFLAPAPGHTPGHITLNLVSRDRKALFTGDIMHHPIQVYYPDWSSGFCTDPVQSRKTRRDVLEFCADQGALMLPAHFGAPHAGRVRRHGTAFAFDFEA